MFGEMSCESSDLCARQAINSAPDYEYKVILQKFVGAVTNLQVGIDGCVRSHELT